MRGAVREVCVFAFYLATAVAFTWPLLLELRTAVADPGDPLLNAWIIDWVCHSLLHAPLRLFSAPIFHPTILALALSEHMTGVAVLVLPFHMAGLPAVAQHNVAILLGFALSGYGAFVLARIVTRDAIASLVAGVFYAFVSFKFDHLSHVQIVSSGWIPLTLAGLILFWRSGARRHAALFAAALVMNGLTNIYWLLFTSVAIGITIVFLDRVGPRFQRRRLLAALAVAALVLLPFLVPYQIVAKTYRMQRTSIESSGGSATWADWLTASPASRLYGRADTQHAERHLFPGLLTIVLAAIGSAVALRLKERSPSSGRRRKVLIIAAVALVIAGCALVPWHKSDVAFFIAAALAFTAVPVERIRNAEAWVAMLWTAVGFAGSFGEHSFLHSFLFRVMEPFRATRTPARWAIIAYCGLAVLAAIGTSRLGRFRFAVLVLALIEVTPRVVWRHVPSQFPPVYGWLARQRPACIVELPAGWNETEAYYVLASTVHRVPTLNGVSGFDPPEHEQLCAGTYDQAMLQLIARNGATVVVVHPAAGARVRDWVDRGELIELARFPDGDAVYSIRH